MNHSITSELISGISNLNTEARGTNKFISEVEPMAEHSIIHIHAAIELCRDIDSRLDDLSAYVQRAFPDMAHQYLYDYVQKIREKL